MVNPPNFTVFPFQKSQITKITSTVEPSFRVVQDPQSGLKYLLGLGDAAYMDPGPASDEVAYGDHTHDFYTRAEVDTIINNLSSVYLDEGVDDIDGGSF